MEPGTGTPALDEFLELKSGLAEDVELRSSWLSTCFLTFYEAGLARYVTPTSGDAGLDWERLAIIVKNVVELARKVRLLV
jgi:hypothetical protein